MYYQPVTISHTSPKEETHISSSTKIVQPAAFTVLLKNSSLKEIETNELF